MYAHEALNYQPNKRLVDDDGHYTAEKPILNESLELRRASIMVIGPSLMRCSK